MSAEEWTEQAAEERWLDDLETAETAAILVRERLAGRREEGGAREQAFRAAAERWLARGEPLVALALLDRSALGPLAAPSLAGDPRAEVPIEAMMARVPGVGGLPALTDAEADSLRQATTPDEALRVIRSARRRLRQHGEEARHLLQRWINRGGDGA